MNQLCLSPVVMEMELAVMARPLGIESALLKLSGSAFCFIEGDFLVRNDFDPAFLVGDRGLSFFEPELRMLETSLSFSGQGIASRRHMFQSFRI